MRPLSSSFNRAVLHLAPAFEARSIAPSTYRELVECRSRLVVWDGASDATIYADAKVNHAFRAWHDSAHLRGGYDFTLAGERAAAELQVRDVLSVFPQAPQGWLDIIRAEVTGQAEFLADHGAFPQDQVAFVRSIICHQ